MSVSESQLMKAEVMSQSQLMTVLVLLQSKLKRGVTWARILMVQVMSMSKHQLMKEGGYCPSPN